EWLTNIHRVGRVASHVGHYSRLAYFAVVENEPIAKIRYRCLQVKYILIQYVFAHCSQEKKKKLNE
ncbi:hypothetical protein PFDG_02776, partial [Plasmodium falciparum Dd2]